MNTVEEKIRHAPGAKQTYAHVQADALKKAGECWTGLTWKEKGIKQAVRIRQRPLEWVVEKPVGVRVPPSVPIDEQPSRRVSGAFAGSP